MGKQKLKFHKLELKNYRPFLDDTLEFSLDTKKPITIVEGKNSAGKTSLVHALNWCLYGVEKHLSAADADKPRCNKKVMYESKIDQSFDTEVKLTVADEDAPKYVITRTLKCKKFADDDDTKFDTDAGGYVPKGITFSTSVNFKERRNDGSWDSFDDDNKFRARVEKLFPKSLSEFVVFNGEELGTFFDPKKTDTNKIKNGIMQVSGLPVLDEAIKHCEAAEKQYRRKAAKDAGTSATLLNEEIESLNKNNEQDKQKLRLQKKQIDELKENEKGLEVEREKYPLKALEELERHLYREEVNKKQLQEFIKDVSAGKRKFLIDSFSFIYCKKILKNAQEILKKSELEGETPPVIHDSFVHELIEKGKCMCGNDLSIDKEGLEKLRVLEESLVGTQIAGIANEGKAVLTTLFREKSVDKIIQELDDLRRKEEGYKSALRESTDQVNGLLAKKNDFDEIQIRKNMDALEKLRNIKGELEMTIPYLESTITAKEALIKNKKLELETLTGASKTKKKWKTLESLASMAKNDFIAIKMDLMNDIKEDVRKTCEEIFTAIIARGSEIKKIEITDEYKIRVIDEYDDDIRGTLTAGQFLFLALAFVSALREVTDTDYPMIIDSPFGKIDAEQRVEMAETLPSYLPDTQMSLFVTDTEIDAVVTNLQGKRIPSIREVWEKEKRIGRTWAIQIVLKDVISKIVEIIKK